MVTQYILRIDKYSIMKKSIVLILITFIVNLGYSQTKLETKEFIRDMVSYSPLNSNYSNFIFFEEDILKPHADALAGKQLTTTEMENIFISGNDVFLGEVSFSVAHVIDIRDISKVSVLRITDKVNYYIVNVYLRNIFHSTEYSKVADKVNHKAISRMQISITDNRELAESIKNAIIHLAKLYGNNNITDGNLF